MRSLADETGITKSSMHRYISLFGLQRHRTQTLSTDAFVVEKVRDIVGLYLNPPQKRAGSVRRREEPDPGKASWQVLT